MFKFLIKIKNNKILRLFRNVLFIFFQRFKENFNNKEFKKARVNFIVERANWAIKWDGIYITKSLNESLNKKNIENK